MKNNKFVLSSSTPLTVNKAGGFTLIEIIVVITIISLLATIGLGSYSVLTKNAADSRRKADLENIRASLEMYKANNGVYPTAAPVAGGIFQDDRTPVNVYMQSVPKDPKTPTIVYNLDISGNTYILGAFLENADSTNTTTCGNCGTDKTCNYCLTPYGQK